MWRSDQAQYDTNEKVKTSNKRSSTERKKEGRKLKPKP